MKDNTSIIRWSIILGSFIIISSILWNTYIFFQNFKSEERIKKSFMEENFPYIEEPFNIGDISFHYGWTFHRAEKNHTNQNREVMTIIYMDMDMRLKGPENENQALDRKRWCPGIEIGQIINSYQNPILYQSIKF